MALRPLRRRWFPLLSLAGLAALLLSFWAFLAAGWVSAAATGIVHRLVGGEDMSVGVYGLRSDLLRNTLADSVVIRGERGLVVRVAPARIRGSVPAFMLGDGLDSIGVGRLEIALPGPAPDSDPDTLSCILESIRAGFVTSADHLTLEYGIITDSGAAVVDSMSIATSISREEDLDLGVRSLAAYLPGLGMVGGSGHLGMRGCVAMTDGFQVESSAGSLHVSGALDGTDGALDFRLGGALGPGFRWVRFPLSLRFSGSLLGRLDSPRARMRVFDSRLSYEGESVELAIDTLMLSTDSVRLRGLSLAGYGVRLSAGAVLGLPDLSWNASADASLASADLSRLLEQAPRTSLTGSVSLRASGVGARPDRASLSSMLSAGSAGPVNVNSASLGAEIDRNSASLWGTLHTPKGSLELNGTASLGAGMRPVSYSGELYGHLSGSSILEDLSVDLPVPTLHGISLDLEARGTPAALTTRGFISIREAEMDSIQVSEAGFEGRATIDFGGPASLAGSLGIAKADLPGLALGGVRYRGEVVLGETPLPRVQGSLAVDSLSAGGFSAGVSGEVTMSDGLLAAGDLRVVSADGYEASADIAATLGDTIEVTADSLVLVRSKMRLMTGGRLAGYWWPGGLELKTLALPTPHGLVSGSGFYSSTADSVYGRLQMDRIDLASLSGLFFPEGGLSGVGSMDVMVTGTPDTPRGYLRSTVLSPAWDPYLADSLTIDVSMKDSVLTFDGVYSWEDGIRSGFRAGIGRFWEDSTAAPLLSDILWAEVELTDIGDWLFYALPMPVRTRGAMVSANAEYNRDAAGEPEFDMQLVATAEEMIITAINQHLPNVSLNVLYSYPTSQPYSARLSLTSGAEGMGKVTAQAMFQVLRHFPVPEIGRYYFRTNLEGYRIVLGSYASVSLNGEIKSQGESMEERPLVEGSIQVAGGYLGMPSGSGSSRSSGGGEATTLPLDLRVDISSSRGLWFRNSMADLELAADLVVLTSEQRLAVNGELSVTRGNVYVLQKDFRITEGRITFEPGFPPLLALDITAETSLRGIMDQALYNITVRITGRPQSPEVVLSGSGPGGELSQEDILSLLATGLTYGQLQQVDTGALGTGLEDIAQGYIGKLLARSLRDDIGLDAFSMSPELLSDTTSFRFNVGKYILPELFVSYEGDVLSSEPGTVSAQYFISEDVYLQGSTKPTVHGEQEPSLELHYTISY